MPYILICYSKGSGVHYATPELRRRTRNAIDLDQFSFASRVRQSNLEPGYTLFSHVNAQFLDNFRKEMGLTIDIHPNYTRMPAETVHIERIRKSKDEFGLSSTVYTLAKSYGYDFDPEMSYDRNAAQCYAQAILDKDPVNKFRLLQMKTLLHIAQYTLNKILEVESGAK